jgi:glycine/D-amino acid oxidase-like deaminating enzyme
MATTGSGKGGVPRRPMRHAVVLGGSVAGLLTARVLADHFERVTLVERDPVAAGGCGGNDGAAQPRRGVPQGAHVHALLARGLGIVEGLFPGLSGELCAAGATLICGGRELRWHHSGGWRVSRDRELVFLSMTRPLLERGIAGRVRALPNIEIRSGVRALGLAGDRGGVTGLRVVAAESNTAEPSG